MGRGVFQPHPLEEGLKLWFEIKETLAGTMVFQPHPLEEGLKPANPGTSHN